MDETKELNGDIDISIEKLNTLSNDPEAWDKNYPSVMMVKKVIPSLKSVIAIITYIKKWINKLYPDLVKRIETIEEQLKIQSKNYSDLTSTVDKNNKSYDDSIKNLNDKIALIENDLKKVDELSQQIKLMADDISKLGEKIDILQKA